MFLLNGEPATHLSLNDRSIHYGDGLYETIAVREGRLEFWQRHIGRLELGCQRLGIVLPNIATLLAEARGLCKKQGDGVLKIILTRGQGGRGYRPPTATEGQPQRIIAWYPWPDYPHSYTAIGVVARLCNTRLGLNPALAGLKHLNRLEQVMARSEWSDPTVAEGLMCDIKGHVIEGSMSNLFFARNGELHTPELSNSGVAGIIREVIIALAGEANIPMYFQDYSVSDLLTADEVFITNSLIGIWPVRQIDKQTLTVGAVTQRMSSLLESFRKQKGEYETSQG